VNDSVIANFYTAIFYFYCLVDMHSDDLIINVIN